MKSPARTDLPERLQYTKYYEYDGMLRAYANRAMVMAFLFAGIAAVSLGFAIFVRLQPPTVIRVNAEGLSSSVSTPAEPARPAISTSAEGAAPTDLEAKAVIRGFLEHYLAYTPGTVDQNLATSLNMMTANLRSYTLGKLRDDDTVGKIKQDRITSQLSIRSIEPIKSVPWTFQAFGVKEVHRVRNQAESTDRIVGRYHIRLIQDRRSESNPSGLLVAEFSEQQMVGERDDQLLQQSKIAGDDR
jgi:hypothetical protein